MSTEPELVDSLSDLMHEAFCLSMDCAHSELSPPSKCSEGGHYFTSRNIGNAAEDDMIFGWCDGLMHKYYQNMSTGHCSIAAMAAFDIEKFEQSVTDDIATMKRLLKIHGLPVRLDHAEMRRRGYTGSWAGLPDTEMKPLQDRQVLDCAV